MNACAGAFAAGIELVDSGAGIDIHLDAAHKVMLAGEDRHRLLGHIIASLKEILIDHGEAVFNELRVLMGNIKIELVAAGLLGLEYDRMGDHISRSQLKALVIVLHEPFKVTVFQVSALAPYRLGDKEALPGVAVIECGGVELYIAEVFDLGTEAVCRSDAVAGGDSGVGGIFIHSADAAGGKDAEMTGAGNELAVLQHQQGKTGLGTADTGHDSVFPDSDIFLLLNIPKKRGFDLEAGSILMVEDAVHTVAAL